jgi:hypothetical protein
LAGVNAFERRLLVAVDAAGYGGGSDQEHFALQSGLTAVLDESAAAAGLRRSLWLKQAMGDGELAILPHDEPEPLVIDDYIRQLDAALADRHTDAPPQARIRLRVAIHFGAAMAADNGYAGQGVVAVSRLVDSPPVHNALAASPDANVAVILSRQVFDDVVRQGHVSFAETEFARVRVQVKEYQDEAWVKVLGVASGNWGDEPGSQEDSPSAAAPAVSQHFHGDVHAPRSVFGISHGVRSDD